MISTKSPEMSKLEFDALLKEKGWTVAELAKRWGFKDPSRIRQIRENPAKNPYFIDAIIGLPFKMD